MKRNQKPFKLLRNLVILGLLAASISCQQRTIKGCIFWNKYQNSCSQCYRRKKTASGGCGPLLPVNDTCLIHDERPGHPTDCALCRKGYGLSNNAQQQCVPLPIFGCIGGLNFGADGIECYVCGVGLYPTQDRSQCAPIANPIPNCLWGGLDRKKASAICTRCVPGYVLNYSRQCVAQTASNTGCVYQDSDDICRECDVYGGYSMQKNGKCKFVSQ